jgi:hypothetical protein
MTTYQFHSSIHCIDVKTSTFLARTKTVIYFTYKWSLLNKIFYGVDSTCLCKYICSAGGGCWTSLETHSVTPLPASLIVLVQLHRRASSSVLTMNFERVTSPRILSILSFSLEERLSDMTSVIILYG